MPQDRVAVPPPGTRLTLDIDSLAAAGDGVGRHQDIAVFVPQTAPGDRVEVVVTSSAARFVQARLVSVLRPGPDRVAPPCPVFAECGGCVWQHLDYAAQRRWKRQIVIEALRRLGHVQAPEALVRETIGAAVPWRYRHKLAVPFVPPPAGRGAPVSGFYAPHSHRVVPFETCAIQHPLLDRALAETRRLVAEHGVVAYDERSGRGHLRHLVGRVSGSREQVLLGLVVTRDDLPWLQGVAAGLLAAVPGCVGVVVNVNRRPGSAILGERTRVVVGADHLTEELDGLRFLISLPSFFQVSPIQAATLYRVAVRQAALRPGAVTYDLYAGVGTLSLFLAHAGAAVEAVESVPEAVRDGRRNATANGATRLRFHEGLAEEVVPVLVARGPRPDAVVLDPPRKGAAAVVLEAVARSAPRRIVYVSCNPATLARDVEILATGGYALREVQPVDMFPQTAHVECSALLERG